MLNFIHENIARITTIRNKESEAYNVIRKNIGRSTGTAGENDYRQAVSAPAPRLWL
jgi:hypothetical protein